MKLTQPNGDLSDETVLANYRLEHRHTPMRRFKGSTGRFLLLYVPPNVHRK
jgi:hypothetical protein